MPSLLTQLLKEKINKILSPLSYILQKVKITPNMLSLFGLVVNIISAVAILNGKLVLGGFLLLFAGFFDLLDGAMARSTKQTTRFGAILDSTLDRYSELFTLCALTWYFFMKNDASLLLACLISIVGSLMISYIKARGEGLGFNCTVGIMTRPERVVVLLTILILNSLHPQIISIGIWFVAIASNITAIHRLLYLRKQDKINTKDDKENSA
ncbi:MAG: CDP-alcohol phosphatidyltransferase family protein [Candidatus Coatesbacteria bacterium]|nr:CDP-alcohol phosphatidyltransferase family protein [Candidatus Coatesbacteria bacterium]